MLLHLHAVCDDVQEKDTLDVVTKPPACQNQVSSQQPWRWLLGGVFVFSLPHSAWQLWGVAASKTGVCWKQSNMGETSTTPVF